jgi:FkbM family methyltransferase
MNKRLKGMIRNLLPRTIRHHRILGGFIRGGKIVTSWHDYPAAILSRTERPLLAWFSKNVHQGETWLDVGAHYGYTAIALCKLVGAQGRVFAFEPLVSTAGCIGQARVLNELTQLSVVPIALGSGSDFSTNRMFITRGMIDSTLRDRRGMEADFLVSRLDWLWPKICGADDQIHGIKIDVQGMEIDVLEGMAEVVRLYRPKLLVELHEGVSRERVLEIIASHGYALPGVAIEPGPGESTPVYTNDRTYLFTSTSLS